jgi:hypothetical protein
VSDASRAQPQKKDYVLPVGNRRGVMFFLIANVFAFALCAAVWALVWYGDAFTSGANAIWGFLAHNSAWSIGAALSPLFAALMLGYGYMRRAMARRAREKAESLQAAARAAGSEIPASR